MTVDEAKLAGSLAREAMMYELTHPGKRSYMQMAEAVERKVIENLIGEESPHGGGSVLRPL